MKNREKKKENAIEKEGNVKSDKDGDRERCRGRWKESDRRADGKRAIEKVMERVI